MLVPPRELAPPPRENPGSATNNYWEKAVNKLHCNDTPQLKPLQLIFRTPCETRMHSSTMRTACSSRRHGGVSTPPPPQPQAPPVPPRSRHPPWEQTPPSQIPLNWDTTSPCEQNDRQVQKYYFAPKFVCGR